MKGTKKYDEPQGRVMNVIYDIIELQNARLMISDAVSGRILYRLEQYGNEWELFYTVKPQGKAKSTVTLEVIGGRPDKEREIHRHLTLLSAMLGEKSEGVTISEVRKPERNGNSHAKAAYVPESEESGT